MQIGAQTQRAHILSCIITKETRGHKRFFRTIIANFGYKSLTKKTEYCIDFVMILNEVFGPHPLCIGRNSCILVAYLQKGILICRNVCGQRVFHSFEGRGSRGRREKMALLIFLFWLALNGRVTVETAGLGAAVTAVAMLFLCGACDWSLRREGKLYRVLPLVIAYALRLIWEIMKANIAMIPLVYGGKPAPVVCTVKTGLKTRMGKMALSNSITLTPGTITLACRGDEVTVHCLTPALAQGLKHSIFEEKLLKIEEALHG